MNSREDGDTAVHWAPCVGRVLTVCAVLWLQVVGVVTESIVHHILHAVPLAILIVIPRTKWVLHTAALVGVAWILMLALITPMIHNALIDGLLFTQKRPPYTWLAPVMVLICAAWSAFNIAALRGRPHAWAGSCLGLVLLAVCLAIMQPWACAAYEIPLEHVLAGHLIWLVVLAIEVPLTLGIPWLVLRHMTQHPRPELTCRSIGWQAAYWAFFLAFIVLGLLPALN